MRPTMRATYPGRLLRTLGGTLTDRAHGQRGWCPPRPVIFSFERSRGYFLPVRAIRRFTVRPVLPDGLHALGELAGNLRWSWHPPTQDLFASIDEVLWERSGHDPVRMLGLIPGT